MPHLKTFSKLHHARFNYGTGTRFGADYFIYDADLDRDRKITLDDLYDPRYNYHFSGIDIDYGDVGFGGRRISFEPISLNNSPEYIENIGQYVDTTGIAINPRIFDRGFYSGTFNRHFIEDTTNPQYAEYGHPERVGIYNLDNYNSFLQWARILLTPRHVMLCGHCFNDFCDLTTDLADGSITYFGAKRLWPLLSFMGKNNQIYKPFNSEQEAIDAASNGTFRLYRCFPSPNFECSSCAPELSAPQGDFNFEFMVVELPDDTWLDTTQVKYYNKIAIKTQYPIGKIIYQVSGSGAVVVPRVVKSNNIDALPEPFGDGSINDSTNQVAVGDSFTPLLTDFNGETILIYGTANEAVEYRPQFISALNEFMSNTQYRLEPITLGFEGGTNYQINSTSYFKNNLVEGYLSNANYGSRFLINEISDKKYDTIAFKPGVQLQAQELNELQDNTLKQLTISNNILSKLICNHLNDDLLIYKNLILNNSTVFRFLLSPYQNYIFQNENYIIDGSVAVKDLSGLIYYENHKLVNQRYPVPQAGYRKYIDDINRNLTLSDELSFYVSESADRIYSSVKDDDVNPNIITSSEILPSGTINIFSVFITNVSYYDGLDVKTMEGYRIYRL